MAGMRHDRTGGLSSELTTASWICFSSPLQAGIDKAPRET